MRNIFIIILLFLSLHASAWKVYVSGSKIGAKKVYVTNIRSEAQMIVFFVSDQNQCTKSFYWHNVSDKNQSDMVICYVKSKNEADLVIMLTNDKNLARTL